MVRLSQEFLACKAGHRLSPAKEIQALPLSLGAQPGVTQLIEGTEELEDSGTGAGGRTLSQYFPPGVGQVVGSLTQLLKPGGDPAQQAEFSIQESYKRISQELISGV